MVQAAFLMAAFASLTTAAEIWQVRAIADVITINSSTGRVNNCRVDNTDPAFTTANCGSTAFSLSGGEFGFGSGWASASYGMLHAYGDATVDGFGSVASVSGGGDAVFIDTITVGILDCAPCGFTGYLRASGILEGSLSGSAMADFGFGFSPLGGTGIGCELSTLNPAGPTSCTTEIAVSEGQTVLFSGSLGAEADLQAGLGPASGFANYRDTAWISNIELLDSNHKPVTNGYILSGSGTDYKALGGSTEAPEPGSWMLWASGAALLLARSALGVRRS
jgi:hypothetical protein